MMQSDAIICEDNYLYEVSKYMVPYKLRIKVYPTVGIPKDTINDIDKETYGIINDIINKYGGYALASTILIKAFDIEKYEAVPHMLLFYSIARKNPEIPIVMFGSSESEFKKVFPELASKIPKNLIFIGKGLSNEFIKYLYQNAFVVVIYVSNRNVSNRFLETLYFKKPVIFNDMILKLYPEIINFIELKLTLARDLDEYSSKLRLLFKHDDLREEITMQVKNAYEALFSGSRNVSAINKLIETFVKHKK